MNYKTDKFKCLNSFDWTVFIISFQRDDNAWHTRVIELFSDKLSGFPVQDIGKFVATQNEEIGFKVGPVCFS